MRRSSTFSTAFRHMTIIILLVVLIHWLQRGIQSLDPTISSQAAMALDHLAAFHFTHSGKDNQEAKVMQQHISTSPTAFPSLLKVVMEVLLTDERPTKRAYMTLCHERMLQNTFPW